MSRWKEASSLIITTASKSKVGKKSPITPNHEKYNFDILALKKNETLPSGNPQICVFPGGSLSIADSIQDWEGLFTEFGLSLKCMGNGSRLPIFSSNREGVPRWLSLKITAIRETFEECGLLLCKSIGQLPSEATDNVLAKSTNHLAIDKIDSWRQRVLEDPYQFFSLCESCKCYPDVENLVLWSNWLTPSHMNERFDAVFYFTHLRNLNLANVTPDNKEISSAEWLSPKELLDLSNRGDIFLKPPQWYEINSLQSIETFDGLNRLIGHKSSNCHLWMPVRIHASDGEISLLPGDDMYPDDVDPFFPTPILRKGQTISSLRCKKMHRMEHFGPRIEILDTRSDSGSV